MKIEELKDFLISNNISIKKKYGQNFLIDNNILENIISSSKIDKSTYVIEIGPGLGFLTNYLSKNAYKVLCYEIDSDMVKVIKSKNYQNVDIIEEDFLKRNIDKDILNFANSNKVVVVANLPYYITTPILLKILEETKRVSKMIVMMQKEVAKRICGTPSTKDYNALSVLMQYYTMSKILFDVSPNSFYPRPGVDSSVVEIIYKDTNNMNVLNEEYFLKFNRAIFSQRRKTLYNNIQKVYQYDKKIIFDIFKLLNLKESTRAEELSVSDIINLANLFFEKTYN